MKTIFGIKVDEFIFYMLFVIPVLIALFYLVSGIIKWITSRGNKAGVEAARDQTIAAVIWLVIIYLSSTVLFPLLWCLLGFMGRS